MGGIPTDILTRVTRDAAGHRRARAVRGRRDAPASPSTAPTGSGTNSLVDLLVFGRRAGRQMVDRRQGRRACPRSPATRTSPCGPRSRACAARTGRETGAADPPAAGRRDDGQRRRLSRRAAADRGAGPRSRELQARYAKVGVDRQGHGLQHGPARGPRARLPARLRRDHGRLRAGPQGEPRRPRPRGLPRARRRGLPDPHPRDARRGRPRSSPTSR